MVIEREREMSGLDMLENKYFHSTNGIYEAHVCKLCNSNNLDGEMNNRKKSIDKGGRLKQGRLLRKFNEQGKTLVRL